MKVLLYKSIYIHYRLYFRSSKFFFIFFIRKQIIITSFSFFFIEKHLFYTDRKIQEFSFPFLTFGQVQCFYTETPFMGLLARRWPWSKSIIFFSLWNLKVIALQSQMTEGFEMLPSNRTRSVYRETTELSAVCLEKSNNFACDWNYQL